MKNGIAASEIRVSFGLYQNMTAMNTTVKMRSRTTVRAVPVINDLIDSSSRTRAIVVPTVRASKY